MSERPRHEWSSAGGTMLKGASGRGVHKGSTDGVGRDSSIAQTKKDGRGRT